MPHPLQKLFTPGSVALVGASERPGSVGHAVLENLRSGGFKGPIRLVNPRHTKLGGEPCHPSLVALGEPIDLAVVTAPATMVPSIVADAEKARVPALAVLSAGFSEMGEAGRKLEQEVVAACRAARIRMLGPNCVGLLRPGIGLNASFTRTAARSGGVAMVSQSGALCTALVDGATDAHIGLSSVVSLGTAADLDFGDILDFLLFDPQTESVLLYVEGVKRGRRFMGALRAIARAKPVVVLKVGRHAEGSRAALSHTGALVGDDAAFDAALRRCGVVRVDGYQNLFAAAKALAHRRKPAGNRIAIVTNGGGPGALAADAAVTGGLELATLSPATISALDAVLPSHWSHANPVDVIGDADGKRFAAAVAAVSADRGVDAVVTAFAPTGVAEAEEVANALIPVAKAASKPVLTSWLGEAGVRKARQHLEHEGIPAFIGAEVAVDALAVVARWAANQKLLLEAPPARATQDPDIELADATFRSALVEERTNLNEIESKALLAAFGIAVPPLRLVRTGKDARIAAEGIGYPVALKIHSRDIHHKSDVNGVRLGIRDGDTLEREFDDLIASVRAQRPEAHIEGAVVQAMVERRNARELLVGVSTDPVFGPVISFGSGGVAVELLRDHAIALPPLNSLLAKDLVSRTRVARLLGAYRNVPAASADALMTVLLAVSDMVCALPWIQEMDLNPLLLDATGAIALDARVVINPEREKVDANWSHLAIHPFPVHLESPEILSDGTRIRLRPIRPEDAVMETAFITELSDESRYRRFLSLIRHVTPEMIARFTQIDYDREMALIAVPEMPDGKESIVAVGRYVRDPDPTSAEFAIVVADQWHGRGLAKRLMHRLMVCARNAGVRELHGLILASNDPMLALMRSLGFTIKPAPDDPLDVIATRTLWLRRRSDDPGAEPEPRRDPERRDQQAA
jgi:acetyltransferase